MVVRLAHANEVIDPRIMHGNKFRFSVKGRTLTITRTDADEGRPGWRYASNLHAYLSTEDIPDFTSTVYMYWGLEHEQAPYVTTEVNFHPSVTTIKENAFYGCDFLVRVTIPDTVTEIEGAAFWGCDSLRFIQLPRNLEFIGGHAFRDCTSLEAVFLPPTVTHIGHGAFHDCASLRSLHVPAPIEDIGNKVVSGCDRLLTTVNYKKDEDEDEDDDDDDDDEENTINNDEVNEWLMQRHANLPFHQACSSNSVTTQVILHGIARAMEVDEYQMTALHILCANPRVTGDAIRAYLQLAPEASNQEDSEGMTPFQYLCRNDVAFVDDRSFSSFMAWWYGCMPPQIKTGGKRRKCE